MKRIVVLLVLCSVFSISFSQKIEDDKRLEWFKDAKLGIFIHWGVYAVNGISESWGLFHKRISHEDYMKQMEGFSASNYKPQEWAKLFKSVGASYAVLTSKHHDGFALWDTQWSNLNSVKSAKASKDLIAPFVEAIRGEGMKVGLYYSLCDWSHVDYPVVFDRPNTEDYYPYRKNLQGVEPWDKFVYFYKGQIEELSKSFKPDLFWFDGDWEHSAEEWRAKGLKDSLLAWNSDAIVNSRLTKYGDYLTPEQGVPIVRPEGAWEFCMTMNDHWGYYPTDTNYKPISQIIRVFVEVIANGGNLLLNIGPKEDGTIDTPQLERLKALGEWIKKHEEAVYSTQAGLPDGHFFGPTLLSKDKKTLYLALFYSPSQYIQLKGMRNKPKRISIVGNEKVNLDWQVSGGAAWNNIPGIMRIDIPPKKTLDKYVTLVKIELEEEIDLYRGHGQAVDLN